MNAIKRRLNSLERSLAEKPGLTVEQLPSLSDADLQAVIDNDALPITPNRRRCSKAPGEPERRFRMDEIATLTDQELLYVIHGSSQGRSSAEGNPRA